MNAKLPTDPPSDENPSPFDLGLTIDDWATEDPEGFDAAVADAFADDWQEVLTDLIVNRSQYFHEASVQRLEKVMEDRLNQEVERNAPWIVEWMRERTEGIEP